MDTKDNKHYVYGNTARDTNYYIENPQPRPQEQEEHVIVRRKIRKINKSTVKSRLQFIAIACLVCSVCMMFVVSHSIVSSKNSSIKELEGVLAKTQDKNLLIREQITKDTNLDFIYQTAVNRLGMVRPNDSDIDFVKVKKSSYTRQKEIVEPNRSGKITFEFKGFK